MTRHVAKVMISYWTDRQTDRRTQIHVYATFNKKSTNEAATNSEFDHHWYAQICPRPFTEENIYLYIITNWPNKIMCYYFNR